MIKPQDLHLAIERGEKIVVVDVNTPLTQSEGHVRGSILVTGGCEKLDLYIDEIRTRVQKLGEGTKIYVMCWSGASTQDCITKLEEAEFDNVDNVIGGMNRWKNEDLPLEKRS